MNEYKGTSRTGLYIMVFMLLIRTCELENDILRIEKKIDSIKNTIENIKGVENE